MHAELSDLGEPRRAVCTLVRTLSGVGAFVVDEVRLREEALAARTWKCKTI